MSEQTREPEIHERDGWRWINRCPRCGAETSRDLDGLLIEGIDGYVCTNGHWADMPNQEILTRGQR